MTGLVTGLPRRLRHCRRLGLLRRHEIVQQATSVEGFDGGYRQAAHPERKLFQWRVGIFLAFQYQCGNTREAQFASQEQADRPSAGNDDIKRRNREVIVHELLLGDRPTGAVRCSVNPTDEQKTLQTAS